jgi:hypothetical protein
MSKTDNFVIEDCVKFKHELHEKSFKASVAKNLNEYMDYVNKAFVHSSWCTNNELQKKEI